MSIRNRLLRGSTTEVAVSVTEIIIGFIMMPFLMRTLGEHYYGMWLIIGTILGYFQLLNFGFSSATQRYLTKYKAQNDLEGINQVLSNATLIFSVSGVVALGFTLLIWYLPQFFIDDVKDLATLKVIVLLIGVKIALTFPSYGFSGLIVANLRQDIRNLITISTLIIRTAAIFTWVSKSEDIIYLALITCIADLICVASTVAYAISLQPGLVIRRAYLNKKGIKELFHYSAFSFLIWLSDQLRFSVDNLVIAANLSLSAITIYAIPVRLVTMANQVLLSLLSMLTPLLTLHHAAGNTEILKRDLQRALEFSMCIGFTLGGGLILLGESFVTLWIGHSYPEISTLLYIFAFITILGTVQSPMIAYLYAVNKHSFYAALNIFDGVANLVLSLLLVRYIGLFGVALGTVLPMLITKIFIQPVYVCNLLAINKKSFYFLFFKGFFWLFFCSVSLKWLIVKYNVQITSWWQFIAAGSVLAVFLLFGFYHLLISKHSKQQLLVLLFSKKK